MVDLSDELLAKYPLISDQVELPELKIILNALSKVINSGVEGAVVEMGCYTGTTSLFISRLLGRLGSPRPFHVYDSFEGLPEKGLRDESPAGTQFKAGELAASKKQLVDNYKKTNLPLPTIHKGWFEDLSPDDLPDKIAFAFLDGDYYSSIKACLYLIENRLVENAVIIVDDYLSEALPGAAKAVDEWARSKQLKVAVSHSLAILHL